MKPVFQRIIEPGHGDCFKCCICSLLELEYEDVPNFVEYDHWFIKAYNFLEDKGYELSSATLYNPNYRYLEIPTECCNENTLIDENHCLSAISPDMGIDGLFLAVVYSPGFTTAKEHPINHLHSVLCDINFNIVHDPNPNYQGIFCYPYSHLIGFNGIREIDSLKKI